MEKHVEQLIEKAAKTGESHNAMNFSQAACNSANAMRVLAEIKASKK